MHLASSSSGASGDHHYSQNQSNSSSMQCEGTHIMQRKHKQCVCVCVHARDGCTAACRTTYVHLHDERVVAVTCLHAAFETPLRSAGINRVDHTASTPSSRPSAHRTHVHYQFGPLTPAQTPAHAIVQDRLVLVGRQARPHQGVTH